MTQTRQNDPESKKITQLRESYYPLSEDAERATLGALLLNQEAAPIAFSMLSQIGEDAFGLPAHRALWRGMAMLDSENKPIDPLLLTDLMQREGWCGDPAFKNSKPLEFIAAISSSVPSSRNIQHYCEILIQFAAMRSSLAIALKFSEVGDETDFEDRIVKLRDQAEKLYGMVRWRTDSIPQPLSAIAPKALEENQYTGARIKTGIQTIDKLTRGIAAGNLLVVGARQKRGKTSFALNVAVKNAQSGNGVLIVSLEMSPAEMMERIVSINDYTLPSAAPSDLQDGYTAAGQLPIWLTSGHSSTVNDVKIALQSLRSTGQQIDLLIIDYLQLMESDNRRGNANRQEQVSDISRALKRLSMTEKIPVLALSQLRRIEKDEAEKPRVDQLRESGAIEQDASAVVLLSNKEMIGFGKRVLCAEVAANRHGPCGETEIVFDLPSQRMTEKLPEPHEEQCML